MSAVAVALPCAGVFPGARAAGPAASGAAAGRGSNPNPEAISQVVLERTCFGCPDAGRLVLRPDGTATLTEAGNARQGTADRVSTGRFAPAEFGRLARLVLASGFFGLDERYADPALQDGTSTLLEVARDDGAPPWQVTRREDAGPAALAPVDAAIARLRGAIRFTPSRQKDADAVRLVAP